MYNRFHRLLRSILAIPLFTVITFANARDFKDFRIQHFADESLPQLTVTDVHSDKGGFLWIGTQMGLVRFDGQEFRVFTPQNTPQLKNVRSRRFLADQGGNLYFVDDSRGLYRLWHNGLQQLGWDSLYECNKILYKRGQSSFPDDHTIHKDGANYRVEMIERAARVIYYKGKDSAVVLLPDRMKQLKRIFLLDGNLVVIDDKLTASLYYPGKSPRMHVPLTGDIIANTKPGSNNDPGRVLIQPGKIFFFFNNAVYRLSVKNGQLHTTALITNIEMPPIISFCEDGPNGYYAIGTESEGLYLLFPRNFSTRLLRADRATNAFYALQQVDDKRFLSGSGYVFDLFKDDQKKLLKDTLFPFCLSKTGNHVLYVSKGYLCEADIVTGKLARRTRLYLGGLQQVLTDQWGRTWIILMRGIARYKDNQVLWKTALEMDKLQDNNLNIETVYLPDSNTFWIAFRDGVDVYDMRTGRHTRIKETQGKYIRNIVDDGAGGAWLLTYGNGYYHYGNGQFVRMPLDHNNYLTAVHTMLPDKNGFYWISTNKGLFRVKRTVLLRYVQKRDTEIQYEYFNRQDGFLTNEFNGGSHPCGYIASDSLFLLPSMYGVVYFNPLNIHTTTLGNDIYIDQVIVDNKMQPVTGKLSLPAGFSLFRCEVSSPYFGNQENKILEYKIEGLTDSWQPLIDNKYVQFNKLPHGNYTVRIRKFTDFGTNSTKEVAIHVDVAAPWYLHTWFIILSIILAALLMWLVSALRIRLLTRQKHKLETQVRERTNQLAASLEQLRDTVQTLEQSQTELYRSNRFKEQFTSIMLHDIQTPLRFLRRVTKNIVQTHQSLSPEELDGELEELFNATDEVAAYSEDFLVWLKSQKDTFAVERRQVKLHLLLEDIGNLYQKIAANAGNTIFITCLQDIMLSTDPALLSIVIRNLTDNAIKYTHNGAVTITGVQHDGKVHIYIRDNGIGMTPAQVEKLMADNIGEAMLATGKLGYHFIKDLLRMLGGTLQIESGWGQGTTVTLSFTSQ